MPNVTDTNGKTYTVTRTESHREPSGIYTQVNLDNAKAITLPQHIATRWINGEIRVKVN